MADVYIDIGAQLDSASLEQIKTQISGMAGSIKLSLGSNNLQLDKSGAQTFVRDLSAAIRAESPGPLRDSMVSLYQQAMQGIRASDIIQPTNASQQASNLAMQNLLGLTPENVARYINQTIQAGEKLINRETIAGAQAFRTVSLADQQKILALPDVKDRQRAIQELGREQLANPLSTGAQAANAALARTQAQLSKNATEAVRIGTEFYSKLSPDIQQQLRAMANGDPVAFAQTVAKLGSGFVGNTKATAEQRAQLRFISDNAKQNLQAQRDALLQGTQGAKLFDGLSPIDQASLMSTVDPSQFPELLRRMARNAGSAPAGQPQVAFQNTLLQKKQQAAEAKTTAWAIAKDLAEQRRAAQEIERAQRESAQSIARGEQVASKLPQSGKDALDQLSDTKYIQALDALGKITKNPQIKQVLLSTLKRQQQQAAAAAKLAANPPQAAWSGGAGMSPPNQPPGMPPPGFTMPPPAGQPRGTPAAGGGQHLSPAQYQQSESGTVLKTYQRAAAFYQAGNILSALGLPLGQQAGLIGSTVQALAPTSLAGSATGIGLGLAGIQLGKQGIEDVVKAYMPVEQQFMRVQTLTQTNKADLAGLEQQVRSLSTTTGLTQEDLAQSLYYISSSGFKGNDAFTILNATVKASAAGLGDVSNVADIVTSMMNAYGIKASGAFTVTDKLITAIREGKAEPEQFARSLGQVLPIAREAGIGLDEVLSSVAAITLQGFSAPQAITSLRQSISNLISPSKEAAKELDLFYGEDKGVITVQKKLQTEGFEATLQDIYKKTGGNLQSLDAIFGNIRGLSGVLALANGEFRVMDSITKEIANSTGATKSAFADATKTTQSEIKKMEAAWEDLKIQLGKGVAPIIIPIITRLADDIALGNRSSGGEEGFARAKRKLDDLQQQFSSPGSSFMASGSAALQLYSRDNPFLAFLQSGGFGTGAQEQYRNLNIADQFQEYYDKANPINKALIGANWRNDLISGGILPMQLGMRWKNGFLPTNQYAPDLTSGAFEDFAQGRSGAGGKTTLPSTSDVFITGEKDKFNKAVAEWGAERAKAIGMIEKLNESLANAIFAGLDEMSAKADGYDSFFGQLAEIDKKLAESPDFVQVYQQGGKATTLSKQQKEDEKAAALRKQIAIDEQKNLIREARKPSKDPQQNVLRGLQDKLYDDQLNAKKNQLAEIEKGQGSRSTITVQNEKDKEALEARKKLLEEYDKQTYDIVQKQFQAGLLGSTNDPEGFNFLLKNGGDLLSKFANNAGLFKSSGFAAAIAEAALQMKYLRGPDGKYLKGEEFSVGFGEYSSALEEFRGKLKDMAPYLSGDQKMTIPIAVDMKLVPVGTTDLTNVGEVRRKVTAGGERDESGKRVKTTVNTLVSEGIDVTTPEGQVRQLMKNMGFDVESGLQASFKINMELASPGLAGEVQAIKTKLEGLDELKNGIIIPVGIALSKTGLNPENLVDKDNKATLQEMFDNLLPKEGEMGKNDIVWTVPLSMVAPAKDSVDTSQVDAAIVAARQEVYEKWKDQRIEALTNITTTVDVAQVSIQNSETMRLNYIRAIEAALGGYWVPPGGKGAQGYATGGWENIGGMRTVGELGPELVYLPKGAGVIPANITNAISGVMPKSGRDSYLPDTRSSSVTYYAPQSKTYMNYSIDARGAQEPKRTREAVTRALKATDVEKLSKKRARETGGRTF